MPHHFSHLDYGLINWTEDQPATRHVRMQMEKDGLIEEMIGKLSHSQDSVEEVRQYNDLSGSFRDYLCVVQRYRTEIRSPNDPSFIVYIKPNGEALPWDAIGQVYIGDARKRMEEIFKG